MTSYWRKRAKAVIDKVITDNPKATPDELKRLIDAAYPFGSRELHPYQIWLKERTLAFQHLGIATKHPAQRDPLLDKLAAWQAGEPIKA